MSYQKHVTEFTPEEAFQNGVDCANKRWSIHSNPYRNYDGYDEQWEGWNNGWHSVTQADK